jgi:regulator of RNase E activity RraA
MAESSNWPVVVKSGDIVMADIHGVVCCPAELLGQVASLCLERTFADEKVMMDVKNGKSLAESFLLHRK